MTSHGLPLSSLPVDENLEAEEKIV
jgi:hypothetical protein